MSRRTQLRLVDPGSMLSTTHPTQGGRRVRLRLARPSDAPRVRGFLEGLSQETLSRRFFASQPTITASLVRHFTFFDPRERMILAATAPAEGFGFEEIAGLADIAFLNTGVAEIGLVVGDDRQGEGVGRVLTEAIATLALGRGATHLKAEIQEPHPAMRRLMESLGPTVTTAEDGHSVLYTRLPARGVRAA